jgi:hypothetical protein
MLPAKKVFAGIFCFPKRIVQLKLSLIYPFDYLQTKIAV